jgi:hypothetical protein
MRLRRVFPLLLVLTLFAISMHAAGRARILCQWSGSNTKTTEKFTVKKTTWCIDHGTVAINKKMPMCFIGTVYKADGDIVDTFTAADAGGSDSTYVHKSGTFYIEFLAINCRWAARVVVPE